jgi:hypothetical protein
MSVAYYGVSRREWASVFSALLVAPPAAGAVVGACFSLFGLFLIFPMTVVFGALFGWPAAFLLGIPAHLALRRWHVTSRFAYAATGVLIGVVTVFAVAIISAITCGDGACGPSARGLFASGFNNGFPFPFFGNGVDYVFGAVYGLIAGFVFRLRVRPDHASADPDRAVRCDRGRGVLADRRVRCARG